MNIKVGEPEARKLLALLAKANDPELSALHDWLADRLTQTNNAGFLSYDEAAGVVRVLEDVDDGGLGPAAERGLIKLRALRDRLKAKG